MARRLVAIHQPNLFPRLSTLAKLWAADVWVVLEDVQFTRRDYQHRARLGPLDDATAQRWMSLSVSLPDGRSTQIRSARVVDRDTCRRRVQRLTRQIYGDEPHWAPVGDAIEDVVELMAETDRLSEIRAASTARLLELTSWGGEIVCSSQLPSRAERSERLADLTRAVGGTDYLCGTGGAGYLEPATFRELGLEVQYFDMSVVPDAGVWRGARRVSSVTALAQYGSVVVDEFRRVTEPVTGACGRQLATSRRQPSTPRRQP